MNVSPATIEIILYYHYDGSGKDFKDSPSFQKVSKELAEIGMLIETPTGRRRFEPNRPMIEFYVDHLCKQPFPVLKYVIE